MGVLGAREQVDHRERVWVVDVRQQLSGEGLEMCSTVAVETGARQVVAAEIIQIFQVPQGSRDGDQVQAPAHEAVSCGFFITL